MDYAGFHAPAIDSALALARAAAPAGATAAWARAADLLMDLSPVIWLYHARGVQGVSRRLQHVQMDLRGELVSLSQWTRR